MKANKKILKIIIIMLILLLTGLVLSNTVQADWFSSTIDSIEGNSQDSGRAGNKVTSVMGAIINIASTVGAGIAIIMLVVIGINYISKGAEGKAEAKKDLTGYVIGAVILFGVSGLLKLIQMFIDGNLNSVGEDTPEV